MAYYINIYEWKPEQVFEWIRGLSDSISVYGKHFVDHGINGAHLMNFGPDDLQMVGINKLGHKLEMMAAINNLRESHLSLDYETLQSLALKVSSKSRSLMAEILMETPEERAAMTRGKVTSTTLCGVTDLLRSVKDLLFWLDRSPFEGQEPYASLRNTLVKINIEMATNAQRDQFAEDPVDVIKRSCGQIITLCEKVVVEFNDPYIAQPATLDVATVKARQDDEMKLTGDVSDCWFLGMHITTNHRLIHLVDGIRFQSAAHQTGKIEVGDEIVQVNYQTVLSWDHKNIQTSLLENPAKVILTVKKRPKHSNTFGQIYIKPYRLPSKKRDSSFRWSEHISSPRHLVIPTVEIASSPAQSSEICQSEIPSEASGGESECDDDTFAAPCPEIKKDVTPVVAPVVTQLYLPKPRVGITRRATVTGVAPSLTPVTNKDEDLWNLHSNTNNLLSQTRPHSLATYASVNTPLLTRSESFSVISELTEYGKIGENVVEKNNNNNIIPVQGTEATALECDTYKCTVAHQDASIQSPVDNIVIEVPPKIGTPQPPPPPRPVRISAEFAVTKGQLSSSRIELEDVTLPRPHLSRSSSKNLVIDVTPCVNEVFSEEPPALPPRTPHAKAPLTPQEFKPAVSSNLEFPAVMPLPPFLTQRVEPPPRTVSPLLGLRLQPPKAEEIHVALDRPKTRTAELGRSIPCRSLQEVDCQGWLYRRRISRSFLGGTRWTRRWYVLRKNTVYGYKDQEDQKAESLMCLSGFNISATADKSKKFVFKIHHSASSFFFACETQEEFDRWLSCLQTACSQPGTGSSPVPRRECYYSETDDDSIGDGEREAKSPSPRKKLLGLTLSPSVTRKNRTPPGLPSSANTTSLGFFSKASPEKVGAASLDRKYLRFLSHEEKPVPTPQYRSYRKPTAEVKKQPSPTVQKPSVPLKPSRMTKSESPPARPPTLAERRMSTESRGRALTEPLHLNLKKSPDNSPQRSNVSSRRSSLDQSRRSSVESRTSPLSPTSPHEAYVGVSPEKAWMNSLRMSKPPVPPKSRSPDSAKLKSVANYQSVKLPLTPDRPMQLAFEMTLDAKKAEKSKFLGFTSPKFGRKVSPAPETPSRFQRTFFGGSSERKKRKGSDNYENLSAMVSGTENPSPRSLVRRDSLLSWSRGHESPLSKQEESPRRPILSPLVLGDDAGPLSPRSCKPTMGVSMIGKQRRTPGINGADVFVYSPPPTPGSASNISVGDDLVTLVSSSSSMGTIRSQQQDSLRLANVEVDQSQRSTLEYPPVFEPGTYSLQRKLPPRPAPRTKFFSTDLDNKSSDV